MSDFRNFLEQNRGYDAFEKKEREVEEKQNNYVNRFWLPADSNAKIVFLDDNPPIIEEHQIQIDGDWKNWFTSFPEGTDVITLKGVKDIKEVEIGDMVLTHMGRFKPVLDRYSHEHLEMVEVKTAKMGKTLVATNDHPVYAIKSNGKNKSHAGRNKMYYKEQELVLLPIDELEEGDYLFIPSIKDIATETIQEYPITPDFAYFLGAYVANGYSNGTSIEICVGTSNKRADKVEEVLSSLFENIDRVVQGERFKRFFINDKKLAEFMITHCGNSSNSKVVPRFIIGSKEESLLESFLKGYVDGDGYVDKNYKVTVSTVSKDLAYQIHSISSRLGYLPSLREYSPSQEDGSERQHVYRVEYPIKGRAYQCYEREDGMLVKVKEIRRYMEKTKVYCLKVAGDESFTANGYAVSNCLRMVGEVCPICENLDNKAYTVGFYTVIDMSEWTDKSGKTHKNELKLFPAKFKTLQMLKRLSAKRGSLEGCVFEVYRSTTDAPNTGDVFDFEEKLTKEQILALNPNAKPFNYAEILQPKEVGEIMSILKKATRRSSIGREVDERINW